MRSPADRPQTSPLALPPVPHARGSSCPQCGRGPGSHSTIVSWPTVVLYRRPQCGQQLQPSLRLGFVRACSDDIKIEIRRSATTTRSQVPNRAYAEVRTGLFARPAGAVCLERRPPRLRHRAPGTLRHPGSPYWSQTSAHRGGPETGDQGARTLAHPPVGQRAHASAGGVAAGAIRWHRLAQDFARDSLRAPSWSTTTQRNVWTLQSLAGGDHCEALAAATNNNLVGVLWDTHEWQNGLLQPVRRKERRPPHRGAWLGMAAPPPLPFVRCTPPPAKRFVQKFGR